MSTQANEWARRQVVGDAIAKSVLRAVADYANENGIAWPSLGRLARDCDCSEDTIRRKIKNLEESGFLARVKMWMDDRGHRNSEGRGRETSHDIRLFLQRQPGDVGPASQSDDMDDNDGEGSQPATLAGCKGSTPATPGVALVQPLYEPSLKKEDSPPTPLRGAFGRTSTNWLKRIFASSPRSTPSRSRTCRQPGSCCRP